MRIDTTFQLACLTLVAACADAPTLPSIRPKGTHPLGSVTLRYPGEDPGPPFYALIEHTFLPHTDEWAPIAFVRDPACVAPTFNLLDQLAVPDAFGCPSSVEGHVTYKNGPPPIDFVPWMVTMHGTGAVPIWFVSWPSLAAAVADDALTISELLAMPSLLRGTATMFELTQQPGSLRPQGLGNGRIELVAHGSLADGRSFSVEIREMGVNGVSVLRHAAIEFR
jgi:hypothetical protein